MIGRLTWLLFLAGPTWASPAAWHVTSESGGELWLLGSIHYLREQDHPLPSLVEQLYAGADTLVMELDLDDIEPSIAQASLVSAGMLPGDERLSAVLSADGYRLAAEAARAFNFPPELLERFEPWLLALSLLEQSFSQLGFHAEQGLELYLLRKARQEGREVLGLESLESQIRVFDSLSYREQEAMLLRTLRDIETADVDMRNMLAAWRNGELESLRRQLLDDFAEFPALYEALVTRRNENWVATLESLLAQERGYLVVVGALHLVGPGSVVELLEKRGLRVRRVYD